jgi:hypothetical protein
MKSKESMVIETDQVTNMTEVPLGQSSIFANRVTGVLYFASNAYVDVNGVWKRRVSGIPSLIQFDGGVISQYNAATGAAEAEITWIEISSAGSGE